MQNKLFAWIQRARRSLRLARIKQNADKIVFRWLAHIQLLKSSYFDALGLREQLNCGLYFRRSQLGTMKKLINAALLRAGTLTAQDESDLKRLDQWASCEPTPRLNIISLWLPAPSAENYSRNPCLQFSKPCLHSKVLLAGGGGGLQTHQASFSYFAKNLEFQNAFHKVVKIPALYYQRFKLSPS